MVSCEECHTSHSNQNGANLRFKASDNSACLYCHAPFPPIGLPSPYTSEQEAAAVQQHMVDAAFMPAPYDPANMMNLVPFDRLGVTHTANASILDFGGSGRCANCHMPKVAKSSGRWLRENGSTGSFLQGDISSHRFAIISPGVSARLKAANPNQDIIPNSCGACHNALTGVRPDYVP
jgi:hypothetical protein